jgi:hypothetical protein
MVDSYEYYGMWDNVLTETYLIYRMLWKLDPFPSSDVRREMILLGWAHQKYLVPITEQ